MKNLIHLTFPSSVQQTSLNFIHIYCYCINSDQHQQYPTETQLGEAVKVIKYIMQTRNLQLKLYITWSYVQAILQIVNLNKHLYTPLHYPKLIHCLMFMLWTVWYYVVFMLVDWLVDSAEDHSSNCLISLPYQTSEHFDRQSAECEH